MRIYLLYISAGKTGSHLINDIIKDSLKSLLSICNVIHQCGDNSVYNDFGILEANYEDIQNESRGKYNLRKFVFDDEIGEAYSKADLVVSRSGAHTISEILYLEKPAIFIPIPWVSHNEQFVNADMVREAGLAEIIEQKDLTPEVLVERVKHCLSNINLYKLKNKEDFKFLKGNPAGLIVDEILKFSKNKPRNRNSSHRKIHMGFSSNKSTRESQILLKRINERKRNVVTPRKFSEKAGFVWEDSNIFNFYFYISIFNYKI